MNWRDLFDQRIFRKGVMDTIIHELPPQEGALRLTEAFLPIKNVDDSRIIALRRDGAFGKTAPAALKGTHHHLTIPGGLYMEAKVPYWRESILFDEQDLAKIRTPSKPQQLWGKGMVVDALNVLDLRLNNRIEQLTSKVVFERGYSIANFGVNYTYTPLISPKYYVDMGATPGAGWVNAPWRPTPANTDRWSDTTNSDPLRDIREIRRYFKGMNIQQLWMSSKVAGYIEDNAQVQTYIKTSSTLAEKFMTVEKIVELVSGLKGLNVIVDDRVYLEETKFTSASAVGDTTLVVQDASELAIGQTATLRNGKAEEEDRVIIGIDTTTPGAHILTVDGTTYAYEPGDRVTVAIPFVPDNTVAFKANVTKRNAPGLWISTPSAVKGGLMTPKPGRYTWNYIRPANQPPLYIEIGAGINGGPVVFGPGGWVTLKVAA